MAVQFPENAIPVFYNAQNLIDSAYNPSFYHVKNTYLQHYFRRYLLTKAMSVFTLDVPENWDRDFVLLALYLNGFIGIFETSEYGVIPQFGSIAGYDLYYRPKEFIVANPYLKKQYYNLTIGENCEIVKLTNEYCGVMDLINYYADQLAIAAETLGVNMFTARVGYVAVTGSKAGAETLKKAFDDFSGGDPFVVLDKEMLREDGSIPWEWFAQNIGQNYIASDILSDMRKIETMFDADIGLENANIDKRERLIVDEVNANNQSTMAKSALWLDNLREGFDKVYKMFGVRVNVERRYKDATESASIRDDSVSSRPNNL